jgi:capsular exopolysaccharide synthesis family protein
MMSGKNLELITSLTQDEKSIFSRSFLRKAVKVWYWFVISWVICSTAALVYLRYATPKYLIKASLLVRDDNRGAGFEDAAVLENLGFSAVSSSVDNEIEILKSEHLLGSVVDALQLHIRYFAAGHVKTSELYDRSPFKITFLSPSSSGAKPAIYRFRFLEHNRYTISNDAVNITASFNDTIFLDNAPAILSKTGQIYNSEDQYSIEIAEKDEVIRRYGTILAVSATNKLASIIELSLKDHIPQKGEAILKELITQYLKNSIDDKNRTADSTLSFITNNLAQVSTDLTSIESGIEQFKRTNGLIDLSGDSRLLRERSGQNALELDSYSAKLEIVEEFSKYLISNPDRVVPTSLVQQESNFIDLTSKYNELLLQRTKLAVTTNSSHPQFVAVGNQIELLRNDLEAALMMQKRELLVALETINLNTNRYKKQIANVPSKERVYLDYSRRQQIKQELYLFLLRKRIETSISRSSTISNARIVDIPKAEAQPVTPNEQLALFISSCLGLGIPLIVLHLKGILNERVTARSDITQRCSVPIAGEISYQKGVRTRLFDLDTRSLVAEQFRILRTNIILSSPAKSCQTILITSAASGEGKSFIALNLTESFAIAGKKVILLELDLRKPVIATYLNLKEGGFSNYMFEDIAAETLIQCAGGKNSFDVITAGFVPPNPAELLSTSRFQQLIGKLREKYQYVIIDAPPIGLVTDAKIISTLADLSLYVLRQNFTFLQQLDEVNELVSAGHLTRTHLVYNGIEPKKGYPYY